MLRIETFARDTLDALPDPFRAHVQYIVLIVEDWPPRDLLDDLQIENPLDLTGLYDGIPLTEKSASDPAPYPDVIRLFAQPILAELEERPDVSLQELVTHVVVHEVAHHFGWSDDDIARIDEWWT